MRYHESCEGHPREQVVTRRKNHAGVCLCRFPEPTWAGRCACGNYIVSQLLPEVAECIVERTPELRNQCA